uniref:Acetylcholinesterase n=1 Tax=Parastrongyloides trichosuri TaxID=131310 RepID=A0A0N4ZJH0_PARTI
MLGYEHGCGYNYSLPANDTKNKCLNITSFTVFASWYELGKFYKATLYERLQLGFKYLEVLHKWPYANIKSMLTNMGHIPGKINRDKMVTAIGDFLFNCDTAKFAKMSNPGKKNKVYFFEFKKNSTVNPWPQWMNPMHGYELEYIFGMPYRNSSLYNNETVLSNEKKYSDKIMAFYGNFAKYGYPNETWHPYKEFNTTHFNNSKCALLDANLTKDDHKLLYRNVITDKCELLNDIAEGHPPRYIPSQSIFSYFSSMFNNAIDYMTPDNIWEQVSNATSLNFITSIRNYF